jgi:hypothetical protein
MDLLSKSKCLVAMALGIAVLSFGSAYGTIIPLTGDPVSLESLDGTLTVGDKVFSDISLFGIGSGGAIAPDEGSIFLQGVQDDVTGDIGLQFLLSWSAFSGQTVNANIDFKVAIVDDPAYENFFIKDVTMILLDASATTSGDVAASETVLDTPPGPAQNPALASLSASKQDGDGGSQILDAAEFSLVKAIWVSKDISITGGTASDGSAHLSGFYQFFSQIPEPATICLLGLGSLPLLRRRRKTS